MKHKRTAIDHALWAALPMAQSSQIEGRLKMILDKTRSRRILTRRVFPAVLVPGTAALVALAVLRPDVKALPAPSSFSTNADNAVMTLPNGVSVRLAGITDTQRRAAWWLPSGFQVAETLPKNTLVYPTLSAKTLGRAFAVVETYALASQPQVVWAATPRFSEMYQQIQPHFSVRRPDETWEVEPNDHKYALDHCQYEKSQGQSQVSQTIVFPQAFEAQTQSCSVQYGVAAGPWTQSVNCAKIAGKTAIQTSSGPVIFTVFTNPHHLPPAQAARGNAVFMVTDHFGSFSPLKSENSTQTMLHDGENYERAVFALDSKGRVIDELAGDMHPGVDAEGKFKYEQLISVPNSLLKNVASFQLVVRPYQWVEFKNVSLQPTQNTHLTSVSQEEVVNAQNYTTPWTSVLNKSRWQPHTTFHLAVHIAPRGSGMRPDPPVTGQLLSGSGKAANFSLSVWKPGRSNFLTVKFDYIPNIADKVHPDIVHLLTKQGKVAAVFTYYSI